VITRVLIALNVIGYLWEISVGGPGMLSAFGAPDARMQRVLVDGALVPAFVLQYGQWWRILTGAFLHGGLIHIGVNMMSLWFLGRFIEYGLGVVYFSSPLVPVVGASGAIFGLFGALFAIGLKLGKPGMELVRANIGILVLNLIITFTVPAIAWQAHVAGLAAGFAFTYAIYFPPRRVAPVVVDASTGRELESEYESPRDPPHRIQ
jgi:membrane associated rhomboid family serine protease